MSNEVIALCFSCQTTFTTNEELSVHSCANIKDEQDEICNLQNVVVIDPFDDKVLDDIEIDPSHDKIGEEIVKNESKHDREFKESSSIKVSKIPRILRKRNFEDIGSNNETLAKRLKGTFEDELEDKNKLNLSDDQKHFNNEFSPLDFSENAGSTWQFYEYVRKHVKNLGKDYYIDGQNRFF